MSEIQLHEATPEPAQGSVTPIRRRSRRGWWIAIAAIAAVIAILVFRPGERVEAPTYITEVATVGDLEEVVAGTGVVGFDEGDLVALAARVGGTVTEVHLAEGELIEPMAPAFDVDGQTVWVVTGDSPVYRDLSVDSEGADVQTVEESLAAAGYEPGKIDEEFDSDTRTALREWQEDNDLEVTGRFNIAGFIWAPADFTVLDVAISKGGLVQVGNPAATAGLTNTHVARVSVDQADVTSIAVGNEVQIDVDGIDGTLAGSVTSISQLPVDGTDFEVVVSIEDTELLLPGMEGSVSIVVDTLRDVVLIPTGALGGSASAPTVDVLVDGELVTRPITIGLTTPTVVEVSSGLSGGDQVVIGEVAE